MVPPSRMRSFLVGGTQKWHCLKGALTDGRKSGIPDPLSAFTFHSKDGYTSAVRPPETPISPCFCFSSIRFSFVAKSTSYLGLSFQALAFRDYVGSRSICGKSGELKSLENNENSVNTSDSKASGIPSRQRLGPSVRRLLIESGIDVATLKGTGPGGAVLKGDVIAAMKAGSSKSQQDLNRLQKVSPPSKPSSKESRLPSRMLHDDLPTSQIQKVIAKHLSQSKEGIPHLYLSADTVLDATLSLKQELKETHNIHISLNDFFIKAVALALKQVPEANAYWDDKEGVMSGSSVDISVAVATEKGLMAPILHNADQKSLSDISIEMKRLAEKAHEENLQPHEFQGGSFSISNLGMFKVDHFNAVINPPQACILAIGCSESSVVWQEDPSHPNQGKPKAVTKVSLTLSADHRVVDVDIGGRFLDTLGEILRDPRAHLV